MSMDFPSHLLLVVCLLLIPIVHFCLRIIKAKINKTRATVTRAPEPPGALPFIGHLHLLGGGDEAPIARRLGAIADEHGPILSIRLGSQPALVVSTWEFVKECFTVNDAVFASRPMMAVGKYMGYDHAVFALAPYGAYWRDVRKIVTLELLSSRRLEKLSHVRVAEVDLWTKDLRSLCRKNDDLPTEVAMNDWFEHLTMNIIVMMLAGKRILEYVSPAATAGVAAAAATEECGIQKAIKKALYLSGIFVISDAIPWVEWFDFGGYLKRMKRAFKEIDEVLEGWVEEHVQKRIMEDDDDDDCHERGDFIDVMLSILPEDTIMNGYKRHTIIKATTLILILTGSESTAETLTWALSLLLNNRHVLKTVQAELDAVVGRERWVQESDIGSLKYLQAVVKETLRLYPPGPLAGPREATEDCRVGGYEVQKGTRLIVNLWKLQRDSRIWSHPDEFKPERFLTDHVDVGFRGNQFEYIPFSSGRRMCPGVTFGLQVVHLALARLLHGFEIATRMGAPVDMAEGPGISLPKMNPLEVVLTPRFPLKSYPGSIM